MLGFALLKIARFKALLILGGCTALLWGSAAWSEGSVAPKDSTQAPESSLVLTEDVAPRFEILLNIPATLLTLFDQGVPVVSYKVSVGSYRWQTPTGKFHIDEIQWNPWWYPPPSEWAEDAEKTPPGPANPLYPVKMMMEDALRIHGTPHGWSIGRAASHGCMRMFRNEARRLAEYLESELKEDHTPENFEKYRRKTWQSYFTKLKPHQEVWVYMVYEPMERLGNALAIHPNVYARALDYENHALDLLQAAGIYAAPLDWEKLHATRKKVKRKSALLPFQDLLPANTDLDQVDASFHPVCWEESETGLAPLLAKARSHYNTRLVLEASVAKASPAALDTQP